ncbi:hypothetical protein Sste5344_008475 [Sporothrix stenoceras]
MLFHPFRPCEGSPVYQKEYYPGSGYVPQFADTPLGPLIIAPDTPYVAAAGRNRLYFIDTRFDTASAKHIKLQIEMLSVPGENLYLYVDDLNATAEVRNRATGETVFHFDPAYARVFFANIMNRGNPTLQLPEHGPAGDWVVTYPRDDSKPLVALAHRADHARDPCDEHSCDTDAEYQIQNVVGKCHKAHCTKAVDKPRNDGETDASYYQRMDTLHWG